MASNRFVETLERLIAENPNDSKRWIAHCHNKILSNDITRCLDLFENFIQKDEIEDITAIFDHIIRFMQRFDIGNNESYYAKQQIEGTIIQLIHLACNNLFDHNGELKPRIVELLELKPLLTKINKASMIPAYLSAAIPLIHSTLSENDPDPAIFGSIIIEINQKLQSGKLHHKIYKNRYQNSLLNQLKDNQSCIALGLAALGTLFYYGIKQYTENKQPTQNNRKKFNG